MQFPDELFTRSAVKTGPKAWSIWCLMSSKKVFRIKCTTLSQKTLRSSDDVEINKDSIDNKLRTDLENYVNQKWIFVVSIQIIKCGIKM